jgi:hypothetical protein
MVIKFVPKDVNIEIRYTLLKYGVIIDLTLISAIILSDISVYSFITNNIGNMFLYGVIAIGMITISVVFIMLRIASIETAIKHGPEQLKFWEDTEKVESGMMTISDYLNEHKSKLLRVMKIVYDADHKTGSVTQPTSSPAVNDTEKANASMVTQGTPINYNVTYAQPKTGQHGPQEK